MKPRERSQTYVFVKGDEVGYARGGGNEVFFPIRIGNFTRREIERMTVEDLRAEISDWEPQSVLVKEPGTKKVKLFGVMVRR